ncbi:hypothetical protein ACLOJK_008541 [Asimina triloba]
MAHPFQSRGGEGKHVFVGLINDLCIILKSETVSPSLIPHHVLSLAFQSPLNLFFFFSGWEFMDFSARLFFSTTPPPSPQRFSRPTANAADEESYEKRKSNRIPSLVLLGTLLPSKPKWSFDSTPFYLENSPFQHRGEIEAEGDSWFCPMCG